jgi:hypothetical protein
MRKKLLKQKRKTRNSTNSTKKEIIKWKISPNRFLGRSKKDQNVKIMKDKQRRKGDKKYKLNRLLIQKPKFFMSI